MHVQQKNVLLRTDPQQLRDDYGTALEVEPVIALSVDVCLDLVITNGDDGQRHFDVGVDHLSWFSTSRCDVSGAQYTMSVHNRAQAAVERAYIESTFDQEQNGDIVTDVFWASTIDEP